MSAYRLDFAGLDLANADGGDVFWFETLADGFSLGSPEAVKVIVASLMRDGSDSRISSYNNRTITFTVRICGSDLGVLSDGEAALSLAVTGTARQQLSWTPPDGYGATTVFEVLNATMQVVPDDLAEIRPGVKRWTYALTLECEPFGHSATPVTQTLTPTAATPTTVDAATATTAWSTPVDGQSETTTSVGGVTRVYVTQSTGTFGADLEIVWTGTRPTADYIGIDVRTLLTNPALTVQMKVGSSTINPESIGTATHGTATYTRYWFPNPATTPYTFLVDDPASSSTYNQAVIGGLFASAAIGVGAVLSVDTVGSVRSVGSITCTRAADPIEWLFLYADPQLGAFSPRLPATWENGRDGTYVVYAVNTYAAGDVVAVSFTDTEGRVVSTLPTRIDAEVAAMSWQPLGQVYLGGFRSGLIGAQTVAVTVDGVSAATPSMRLFRLADDTTLTFLDGISGETVTVQSPSVDYPVGGYWVDGVDVAAKVLAPGFPTIAVPSTALFAEANDSDTSPVVSTLNYPACYHTYAAS